MKNDEPKIEKNVPIPKKRTSGVSALLRKLKVGESILLPKQAAYTQAYAVLGKGNCTIRSTPDGVRVWRIK